MTTNWKKTIAQMILLIGLISFAFWFALKDDYQEVLHNLKSVSLVWIGIIFLFGILYYLLQGYMLYTITKPYKKDVTFKDGCYNAYIAAFFNGVTPLGGGQVAQTYAFRKLAISYQDIRKYLVERVFSLPKCSGWLCMSFDYDTFHFFYSYLFWLFPIGFGRSMHQCFRYIDSVDHVTFS